jgi:hypothetical protein
MLHRSVEAKTIGHHRGKARIQRQPAAADAGLDANRIGAVRRVCVMAAGLASHRARQQAPGRRARCKRVQQPLRTDSLFTASLSAFDRSSAPLPWPGQVVWRQVFLKKTRITGYGPVFRASDRNSNISDLDFQPCPFATKEQVLSPVQGQRFRGTAVHRRALPEAAVAKFVV